MLMRVKSRAKANGVPFTLTLDDLHIPEFCPVLGVPLKVGTGDNAPSLDRLKPELGYVPGNVIVVSHKANRLRSNATLAELAAVAAWYCNFLGEDRQ